VTEAIGSRPAAAIASIRSGLQEHHRGALAGLDDMHSPTAAGLDHSTLGRGGADHLPMKVEHLIGACASWFSGL
jgi:hypothetical protein